MKPNFKYVTKEDLGGWTDLPLALDLLSKERLLIDAAYLPVLELAEKDWSMACFEMQEAFAKGTQGVPKHYGLARRYTDKILGLMRGMADAEVEAFRNSAKLELSAGHTDAAKKDLLQAAKIMVNDLPLAEWDFGVFHYLQNLVESEMDVEQGQ